MSVPPLGKRAITQLQRTSRGSLSTSDVVATVAAVPPIQVQRWARNGKHPNALLESAKAESGNGAVLYRTKEVFRGFGRFPPVSTTSTRWRFAFHSGPYTRYLQVVVLVGTSASPGTDPYAQVDITDGTNTITDTFHLGTGVTGTSLGAIKRITKTLTINPDTDYFGTFTDNGSELVSATCFEYASLTEMFGGYLPQNVASGGAILDASRQNLAELLRPLWKRGAAQVLNWSVDDGTVPIATASTTPTNIIDTSSTTVSVNTPGYMLDFTHKARVSQTTGIPFRMCVYASPAAATGSTVRLVSSSGVVVATVTMVGTSLPTGWYIGTGLMPAAFDKYDLQFAPPPSGGTLSLYAASIYEYEA